MMKTSQMVSALALVLVLGVSEPADAETTGSGASTSTTPPTATPSSETGYRAGLDAYSRGDVIAAMALLEAGAEADHAPSLALLAQILDKANEDVRAVELYRRAASQGNADAEFGLGGMYAAGEGVERDFEQALSWIERAAEHGHGPAIVALADAHWMGELGLERDPAAAMAWLEKGAAIGYEPARVALEAKRARGEGTTPEGD